MRPRSCRASSTPPERRRSSDATASSRGCARAGSGRGRPGRAARRSLGGHGMGKTRARRRARRRSARATAPRSCTRPAPARRRRRSPQWPNARETTRPTLLVVDDADRGSAERARSDAPARDRAARPPVARRRHRPGGGGARAPRPSASIALRAARRRRGTRRSRSCTRPPEPRPTFRSMRCSRRAAAWRGACTRRRASGRAGRRRGASTPSPTARRPAARRRVRWRRSWPAASSRCSPRTSAPRASPRRTATTGRLPLQGSRDVRRRRRPVLLRARAARRRAASRGSSARRCSAIVGPSGSGKSSVLRAGLLPALAGGRPARQRGWAQVLIRPGEHPMRELPPRDGRRRATNAASCSRWTSSRRCSPPARDERERDVFVAALVRAARDPEARCVVVLAVRADFYGRCAAYPELRAPARRPTTCSSAR